MATRRRSSSRILALFRSRADTITPIAADPVIDGIPIAASVDYQGNMWVKIAGMAAGLVQATQAILSSFSGDNALLVTRPGDWAITHDPAGNTQATITRAGVAGKSHVCTSISATITNNNAAATALLKVYLRDGASGVGAILWSGAVQVGPNTGTPNAQIRQTGLNIVGTAGNAMTLEFSAAGGANTQENVSLTGYDV